MRLKLAMSISLFPYAYDLEALIQKVVGVERSRTYLHEFQTLNNYSSMHLATFTIHIPSKLGTDSISDLSIFHKFLESSSLAIC